MFWATDAISIKVKLGGAATTTELPITGCYTEVGATGSIVGFGNIHTITTGSTAVSVVGVASSGNLRKLQGLRLVNVDTAAATVTVYQDSGTARNAIVVTLAVGYQLNVFDNGAWEVRDANGAVSGSGGAPTDADYLVKTANSSLSAERVVTDTTPITWDWSTTGQAKALIAGATTLYGAFDKLTVKGSSVASASTTDLSTATGAYVYITGNTTINAFGNAPAGTLRFVRFTSNPTITHGSYLICTTGASITAVTDDTCILLCEGGSPAVWSVHNYTRFDGTSLAGASAPKFALYQHQLTSGTNGGTSTAGSWQTVPLNTEVYDAGSIGSLSSNQVTLAAGNYYFHGFSPLGQNPNQVQLRLYNATDSSVIQLSTNGYTNPAGGTSVPADIDGYFTLSGSKAIELQYRVNTGAATYGLGIAASWGTEVYGNLMFVKY